jgi:MoxR-like ATPase
MLDYIIALVSKTRSHPDLERGASPRATLALTSMARSYAYLFHRNYVIPGDIQAVFNPVMCHRLMLTPEAEVSERRMTDITKEILKSVSAPKI